jgi:hypothetical protein
MAVDRDRDCVRVLAPRQLVHDGRGEEIQTPFWPLSVRRTGETLKVTCSQDADFGRPAGRAPLPHQKTEAAQPWCSILRGFRAGRTPRTFKDGSPRSP